MFVVIYKIIKQFNILLLGGMNMFEFIVAVLGLFIMSKYEKWKCAKDYREYMTEQERKLGL